MTHVTNVQMTLDCADPHAQARFWAQALGWVVERNSAMIRSLLDQGVATADQVVEIDGELAWRTVEAIRHPEHDAIRELGGVFGVAVLASIFSANGGYATGQTYVDGLVPAMQVGAVVVALGALAALALGGRPRLGATETEAYGGLAEAGAGAA